MTYDDDQTRCECCGRPYPYLELKCVKVELPTRRVDGMVVAHRHNIYRFECRDCWKDRDGS